MRTLAYIGVLLLLPFLAIAQFDYKLSDDRPMRSFYVGILGDASIVSLNGDMLHQVRDRLLISTRLGLGINQDFQICIFGPCDPPATYLTFPHHLTANLGSERAFFEFGLGATLQLGEEIYYIAYPILGLRIAPLRDGRVNFRLYGQYPISNQGFPPNGVLFSPIGASLGISFTKLGVYDPRARLSAL